MPASRTSSCTTSRCPPLHASSSAVMRLHCKQRHTRRDCHNSGTII
jgi:hypothetical protein